MEPPNGMETPNGMKTPDGMEPPNGMETPNGMEPSDHTETPDRADNESAYDNQEMREVSGRPFTPGERQSQEDDMHSQQREWGQKYSQEDISSSNVSTDTLVLLGISVFVLMIGLFIALKIKH